MLLLLVGLLQVVVLVVPAPAANSEYGSTVVLVLVGVTVPVLLLVEMFKAHLVIIGTAQERQPLCQED